MEGIILKAISGFYYVCCNDIVYECKARGNFRKNGVSPTVGDIAEISVTDDNHGVVEKVLPRKNLLYRPSIANIDKLFIISSFVTPSPNALEIDRLIAIAEYSNIEPIIVFNKCDMGDFSEWEEIYKNSGFKTFVVSAINGSGIEEIKKELDGSISAFTGNSGVGKSSIINALFAGLRIATGDVSQKLGRGRHTTRHVELYKNSYGGYVADTPGFSSIDVDKDDYNFKESLAFCFRDFSDYLGECKFTSCTHTSEKGCKVIEALNSGKIEKSRYNSYIEIFNQLKGLKRWESVKK